MQGKAHHVVADKSVERLRSETDEVFMTRVLRTSFVRALLYGLHRGARSFYAHRANFLASIMS
jgi:hypothetical protein